VLDPMVQQAAVALRTARSETMSQSTTDRTKTLPQTAPAVVDLRDATGPAGHEDLVAGDVVDLRDEAVALAEGPAPEPEHLITEHLSLARALAHRYRDRGESMDDLLQVAYLGLVKAANNYVAGQGPGFTAYAVPTITGELRRHFRDHGWDVRPPRRLQELRSRARAAETVLLQELGRAPSRAELAERLDVPASELDELRVASEGYDALSLDAPPPGADASDWSGADSVADLHPAEQVDGVPVSDLLDAEAVRPLLERLSEREMLILALRYYGGYTQQQIAERIGVTQMQVSRLISQLLTRLRAEASAAVDGTEGSAGGDQGSVRTV
jgi:RNA polymerase sigma-B factor